MIISPIAAEEVAVVLAGYRAGVADHPLAGPALARIAATWPVRPDGVDTPAQRTEAAALAHTFGLETLEEEPQAAFSWDGRFIRTQTEASVIVHEVAHWQLCAPERRGLFDFGLGAGPETGRRAEADAVRCVSDAEREWEEVLTSLLGVLWEAELGHPAILAFLEQNWLEGHQRPTTPAYFSRALEALAARGLIGEDGRPLPPGR